MSKLPKTMARLDAHGIVANLEWHSGSKEEEEDLKNVDDLTVAIGDQYINGIFYHQGGEVKTPIEEANARIGELQDQLSNSYTEDQVNTAYMEGVNSL